MIGSQPPTNRKPSGAHVVCIDQLGLDAMENGAGGGEGDQDITISNTARSSFNMDSTSGKTGKNSSSATGNTYSFFPVIPTHLNYILPSQTSSILFSHTRRSLSLS